MGVTTPPAPSPEITDNAGDVLGYWGWRPTDISGKNAAAVTASRLIMAGGVVHILGGWSIRETTNAAGASFRLRDGSDTNGEVLACINLSTNESNREIMGSYGIRVHTGRVYLEVLSGSIDGVIYWR